MSAIIIVVGVVIASSLLVTIGIVGLVVALVMAIVLGSRGRL